MGFADGNARRWHAGRSVAAGRYAGGVLDDFFFRSPLFDLSPSRSLALASLSPVAPAFNSAGPNAHFRATKDAAVLEFEVPRFKTEDIKLETNEQKGRITIAGERKVDDKSQLHAAGTSITSFRRSFAVDPSVFDFKGVTYTVEHGLLTVTVPLRPQEQKKIDVPATATAADDVPILPDATAAKPEADAGKAVATQQQEATTTFEWPPKLTVANKSDKAPLTYTLELPAGAKDAKVQLNVRGKLLTVDVSHTVRRETKHGYSEQYGSFSRSFPLPDGATKDKVKAQMQGSKLVIEVNA